MDYAALSEVIVAVVFGPLLVIATIAFLYLKWWRPNQLRAKAAAELETFDEFGLTCRPFAGSRGGALFQGTYRGYDITIDPSVRDPPIVRRAVQPITPKVVAMASTCAAHSSIALRRASPSASTRRSVLNFWCCSRK